MFRYLFIDFKIYEVFKISTCFRRVKRQVTYGRGDDIMRYGLQQAEDWPIRKSQGTLITRLLW